MRVSRRFATAVSAGAVGLGLLTACLPPGPAGVVVAKAYRTPPASKSRPYFLTVRTTTGDRNNFQVLIHDFDRCSVGEHYPACAKDS